MEGLWKRPSAELANIACVCKMQLHLFDNRSPVRLNIVERWQSYCCTISVQPLANRHRYRTTIVPHRDDDGTTKRSFELRVRPTAYRTADMAAHPSHTRKLKSQGVGPRPCRHWGAAVCHWGACVCVIGVYVCVIGVYLRVSLGCICVCHWGVSAYVIGV